MAERPWPAGTATGIGSLPGTDPTAAFRSVLDDAPDLPYLPELPGRGMGSDMIGRTCAVLLDLPVEWQPHGWTVAASAGRDLGRAHDHLMRDLDAVSELGHGLPALKIAVTGPMTLGATLELQNLHKILTDHGAFRDLVQSLVEGVRAQLADLRLRLPGTEFVLQIDEPSLPQVLGGRVPTPSGYGTVRALEASIAQPALEKLIALVPDGHSVVHCCGRDVPWRLITDAGAAAVSVDAAHVRDAQLDDIGDFIERGGSWWLGVVPGTDAPVSVDTARAKIRPLWNKLGFAPELLATAVVPTPSCGLAGATMPYVHRAMSVLRDTAASLRDAP